MRVVRTNGRPRRSAAALAASGSKLTSRRAREEVVVRALTSLEPPPWMQEHPDVLAAWQDIAPAVLAVGIATEADRGTVELLAQHLALYRRAWRDAMTNQGPLTPCNTALSRVVQLCDRLGLSPIVRSHLSRPPEAEPDELEEYRAAAQ